MPSAAGYFRQGILATDNSGVSDTTIVATLPTTVRPGSMVAATVGWFSVGTDTGADNPQLTADKALPSPSLLQIATGADTFGMTTFLLFNTTTGPQQFTITFSVATRFQWLAVDEYISIKTAAALDDTDSQGSNAATVVINAGIELVYVTGFSTSGGSASQGAGFTSRQTGSLSGNNTFFLTEDDFEIATNAGLSATFTTTGSSAVCLINAASIFASPLGLQVIPQQWSDGWKDIRAVPY